MPAPAEFDPRIRWWRVLAGGFLIELVLTIVGVPFFASGREADLMIVVPPATLVVAALFGAWTARGTSRPLMNGLLAGVAAFAIYLVLLLGNVLFAPVEPDFAAALSASYLASHAFKLIGAGAGGMWVARRE
jgi:hypothetical protein